VRAALQPRLVLQLVPRSLSQNGAPRRGGGRQPLAPLRLLQPLGAPRVRDRARGGGASRSTPSCNLASQLPALTPSSPLLAVPGGAGRRQLRMRGMSQAGRCAQAAGAQGCHSARRIGRSCGLSDFRAAHCVHAAFPPRLSLRRRRRLAGLQARLRFRPQEGCDSVEAKGGERSPQSRRSRILAPCAPAAHRASPDGAACGRTRPAAAPGARLPAALQASPGHRQPQGERGGGPGAG